MRIECEGGRSDRLSDDHSHEQRPGGIGCRSRPSPCALAGLASFLSPCMLPVIPAFLAQLVGTSLDHSDLRRRDVLVGTILFVLGFSAVFAALGVVLGAVLQGVATEVLAWLSRLAGTVVILLGLHLTGLLRLPILDRQYGVSGDAEARKPRLFLFGASFAVAWTPCVGPILGSTLALATTRPAARLPAAARLRRRTRGAVSARRPVPRAGLLVPQTRIEGRGAPPRRFRVRPDRDGHSRVYQSTQPSGQLRLLNEVLL